MPKSKKVPPKKIQKLEPQLWGYVKKIQEPTERAISGQRQDNL